MPAEETERRVVWLFAPAVLVWAAALVVVCAIVWFKPARHCVYSVYAYAGRGWSEGCNAYFPPRTAPVPDHYRYSPLVTVFFAGLSVVPERIGGILWRLLGAALVVGGFRFACRALDKGWAFKTEGRRQWLWLLLLPLCVANLNNGQANLHVAGLLLIGVAAVAESRWNLAAIVLMLACSIKVYPIALVGLLVLLHPGQLGWRFAAALVAGLALPFLAQSPQFVLNEYRTWAQALLSDNRFSPQNGTSYRDLSQLLFRTGLPIDRSSFFAIQVGLGAAAAAACLFAQRRLHWDARRLVVFAYCLGTFWMLLCGPCTESSTYVLIAPVAAWLVVESFRGRVSPVAKWLIVAGAALVHFALFSSAFPFFRTVLALGAHPFGALLMLVGYLIAEFGARNADTNDRSTQTESRIRLGSTIRQSLQNDAAGVNANGVAE